MFRLLILFLLFSNSLFGLQNPAKLGHRYSIVEIKEVLKNVNSETGKETFILFTEDRPYVIESLNEYATVKVSAFLKTKKGTKQKVVLHYNYFDLGNGIKYQFGFKVCNVFAGSKESE